MIVSDDEEINNEQSKKKGISSKFSETIDNVQSKRNYEMYEATNLFFKSLGYKLEYIQINENGDHIVDINGIEYTPSQFNSLIKMMKSCIDDVNVILGDTQPND